VPIVDRRDRIFPWEGCFAAFARVFLGLLVLGEGLQSHEILHHAAVLKLVLIEVHMVQAGLLEESLEVVYCQPHLALDTAPGGRDALLIRTIHFLVVVAVVVGHGRNPLRAPVSPLLVSFGILLRALDGDAVWRYSTAASDRFPIAVIPWFRKRQTKASIHVPKMFKQLIWPTVR
jgi:hypothetical protein